MRKEIFGGMIRRTLKGSVENGAQYLLIEKPSEA
jgi:hypothetical protein